MDICNKVFEFIIQVKTSESRSHLHNRQRNQGSFIFNAMKKLRCVDCRCFKYEDSDGLGFCDKWEESDISRDDDACVEFEKKEDEYDERFGNTEGY